MKVDLVCANPKIFEGLVPRLHGSQSPSLVPGICPASIACKTEKRERARCLQDSKDGRKDFNCACMGPLAPEQQKEPRCTR